MANERVNYFRFLCLMTEVVADVLRSRLKQSYIHFNVLTLTSFLKDKNVLHTFFHLFFSAHLCCNVSCKTQLSKVFSKEQWNILYDTDPTLCCKRNQKDLTRICICCVTSKNVDESNLDLSLLSLILNNCCNLNHIEKAAVQTFREMKNKYISHTPKFSLSNSDFESLWHGVEYNIKHLDSTNTFLYKQQNLLHRPMDEPLMQKYFVYILESTKMEHLETEVVHDIINRGNEYVIETITDGIKKGSEDIIEAIQEFKSSFKLARHALDEKAENAVHGISTKRKREESIKLFDVSYEQDHADDSMSPKRKQMLCIDSFKGHTDELTYKPVDTKVHDKFKEYISSNLLGSNISNQVRLQTDFTVLTMKGLAKQPGFKEADKFICGKCCQLFVSLDQFIIHKGECTLRQKENELVKNKYKEYVVARITVPTKDQDISAEVEKNWKEEKLNPKHNSIKVIYITTGSVVIWVKVNVLVFLDINKFYSAIDDLVNGIFQNYQVNVPLHRVQVYDIATGYVDHITDEFYCGDCKIKCNTLDDFISHKNTRCFQSHLSTCTKINTQEASSDRSNQRRRAKEQRLIYEISNANQAIIRPNDVGVSKKGWNVSKEYLNSTPKKSANMTYNFTSEQLTKYKNCLVEWSESCSEIVKELNSLADNLDEHFRKMTRAKISGSAAGVVGGILAIFGFGLSFVTFGASLGLYIAGGVIAGAGGLTVGGSAATDAFLSRKRKRAAEEIIKKYNNKLVEVKNEYLDIHVKLQKRAELSNFGSSIEETFPHWIKFWWNLVKGAGQTGWSTGGSIIYTTIKSSFQLATVFDNGAINGVKDRGGIFKNFRTVGRAFCVVEGVANIMFLPLDIFEMVDSAIGEHKNNPHEVSSAMRKLAKKIEEQCPTKDSIKTMIAKTLKQLENV